MVCIGMLPYLFGFDARKQLIFAPHLPRLHRAYELRPQDRRAVHLIGGCVIAGGIDLGTMIGNIVAGFPVALSVRTNACRLATWLGFILIMYVLGTLHLVRHAKRASDASFAEAGAVRLRVPMTSIVLGIVLILPAYIGLHMLLNA
jgi:hypothetical protein